MQSTQPFTSESVTEGHPDKVCDRISDSVLDAVLAQDSQARVAVEVVGTKGLIHVVGELTTEAYVEIPQIVREEVLRIGYDSQQAGFDGNSCGVSVSIGQQSPDISGSVTESLELRRDSNADIRDQQGAGDQGIMFGFACDETPDLMPAPIWLAHRLARKLSDVRRSPGNPGLLPDGKTQVTLRYADGIPVAVDTIVVSTQHLESIAQVDLEEAVRSLVVDSVLAESGLDLDTSEIRVLVNPSGRFVLGGPAADAGLTGRKIIVDSYGGSAPHGGGAFSGKDPSKVDRSGTYAARWVAKNVVAAGLAKRCEIQLSYAIGSARPVSIAVDTRGTGIIPDSELSKIVQDTFDLRPRGIIEDLGLLNTEKIKYQNTAAYGHFGREEFPWESLERVPELRSAAGI
ncbi:methionine adenosyltransferase [Actinomycetaceae bacterium MB13-C1-2]|nr:methionine adenosyltransferase [Actinomycetaceae bacterium MB13-C1-2]